MSARLAVRSEAGWPSLDTRFATLRAASRALDRLIADGRELHRLADALTDLADLARTCEHDASNLGELHAQIDAAEDVVRDCLDSVDAGALLLGTDARPVGGEDERALLDLALADASTIDAHAAVVEYLIAVLSIEVRGARRAVVRDPASLSPRQVEWIEATTAGRSPEDVGAIEREILEAAQRVAREPREAIEAELADLRARLGPGRWKPTVLRALTFYRACAWDAAGIPATAPRGEPATRSDRFADPAPDEPGHATRPEPVRLELVPEPTDEAPSASRRDPAPEAVDEPPRPRPEPEAEPVPTREAAPGVPPGRAIPASPPPDWDLPAVEPAPRPAPPRPVARPRWRTGRVFAVVLLAAALSWMGLREEAGDVRVLPPSDLERISPWLSEGYRSDAGVGPFFVGTFEDDWNDLGPERREEISRRMVRGLQAAGVTEIMVYDRDRRLRVQVAPGLPAQLGS